MKRNPYLWAIASGILLVSAFPPLTLYPSAFVGLIPLLLIFRNEVKRPFLLVYLTFFIYCVGTNWWISSWQEQTDPFLFATGFVIDVFHPFFFFIPFVAFFYLKRKLDYRTAISFFPFIWTAFEWLHSNGDLGYSWLNLGTTQINYLPWIQFIDITGIYGASFLIVLANVMIIKLILLSETTELSIGLTIRKKPQYTLIILAVFLIPGIYGLIRLQDYNFRDLYNPNQAIQTAIIQPNINPWEKWAISPLENINKHIKLQDSLFGSIEDEIDISIWSETAIPFLNMEFNQEHNFSFLQDNINSTGVALLTGFADAKIFKAGENAPIEATPLIFDSSLKFVAYNSALMLQPTKNKKYQPQIYHKMHLTPFAERIPYYNILSPLRSILKWGVGISNWGKGDEQKNLILYKNGRKINIAPIICIESIFPDFVRNFTAQGADIFVIITNDAWYDYTWGPEQHWDIARLRAIENRRFIVRTANTGVSGLIGPDGKELLRLKQYSREAVLMPVPLMKEKSFYVRFGDWFAYLTIFMSITSIFIARFRKKR